MFKDTTAFVSFSAPDLAAIKEFYGNKLGIAVKDTKEGLELHLAGGGLPVFVYPSDDYHAPEHTVLNFLVPDIDAAIQELTKRGVAMEQYDMAFMKTDATGVVRNDGTHPGPMAIAWFKDPADHILAIIQEK